MALTAQRLKDVLRYDSRSGHFFWKQDTGFKDMRGKRAGCANKKLGYWIIGLDGKRHYAHALAWLYVYGSYCRRLEFINKNGLDTRIANLREKVAGLRCEQTKICPVCSTAFNRPLEYSAVQWNNRLFCSKQCSEEQKRRVRAGKQCCKTCGSHGPFHTYITSSGRRSRRMSCKACFNAARRPKRKTDEQRAKDRAYVRKFKEKYKHEPHRFTYSKAWAVNNPEKYLFHRMQMNQRQHPDRMARMLSYDEFINEIGGKVPSVCPVLGIALTFDAPTKADCIPSVDRIDASKPYQVGNIAVISWRANRVKYDATADEHRKIATWMDKMARKRR
jgi:hypothetical protein